MKIRKYVAPLVASARARERSERSDKPNAVARPHPRLVIPKEISGANHDRGCD